jgi:hypothetical protein
MRPDVLSAVTGDYCLPRCDAEQSGISLTISCIEIYIYFEAPSVTRLCFVWTLRTPSPILQYLVINEKKIGR